MKYQPQSFVSIIRQKSLDTLHGALLRESKNWVLIQNIEDFRIDGWNLIHRSSIKKIRQDKSDKYYQYILESEKVSTSICDIDDLSIEDITDALTSLKKIGAPVMVDCELTGEWKFSIGFIEQIRTHDFDLRYFDPVGKLDKKLRKIDMADVDRIRIKERYSEVMKKYLKN